MEIKTLWQSQARCFVIALRGMKAGAELTAPSPSRHVTALVSSKCLVTADSEVLETLGNFILIAYTPQGEKTPPKNSKMWGIIQIAMLAHSLNKNLCFAEFD